MTLFVCAGAYASECVCVALLFNTVPSARLTGSGSSMASVEEEDECKQIEVSGQTFGI